MTVQRRSAVRAGAATAVGALVTFSVIALIGPLFFLPGSLLRAVIPNGDVAMTLTYIVLPLVGFAFWRWPWWGRWICLGFLLSVLAWIVLWHLSSVQSGGTGFLPR